jgi:glucokinase
MRVAGAVDIGATRTKLGIVAEDGRVIERESIPTNARAEPASLIDRVGIALEPLLHAAGAHGTLEPGVGISVAGFLDPEHTTMVANANLPLLCGFPLRRELEQRLGRACRLEVDSNASTVAEYRFGAARGSERFLGITIGTGLGGGVILQGQLLRYTGGCAGDLGHVIVAPNGRRCSCGAQGCLEAMVCSAAVSERAGNKDVREIVRDAERGDGRAIEAFAETARWLGMGLASLSPLFAPDTIIVGGGVAAAGDLLLEPTRASFRANAGDDFRDRVRIAGSEFGGWEGIVGAASLIFEPLS